MNSIPSNARPQVCQLASACLTASSSSVATARSIADRSPTRDRARGLGQGNAQRTCITDYRRVIDNALHGAHGPIRKTLEPQYPCEKRGSDDPLVILKAYGMRPANGSDIAS